MSKAPRINIGFWSLRLYAASSKLLMARFLEAAKLMPMQLRRNPVNLVWHIRKVMRREIHSHLPEEGHSWDGALFMRRSRGSKDRAQDGRCNGDTTFWINWRLLKAIVFGSYRRGGWRRHWDGGVLYNQNVRRLYTVPLHPFTTRYIISVSTLLPVLI